MSCINIESKSESKSCRKTYPRVQIPINGTKEYDLFKAYCKEYSMDVNSEEDYMKFCIWKMFCKKK